MIEWTLKDAHCSGHPWASQVRSRPQMELIYTTQPILEDWSVPYIESESTYRLLSYFIVTRFRSEQEVVTAVFWAGAAEFFFFTHLGNGLGGHVSEKFQERKRRKTHYSTTLSMTPVQTGILSSCLFKPLHLRPLFEQFQLNLTVFLEQTPEGLLPRQS